MTSGGQQPVSLDMWGWFEKMLDLLPKPDKTHHTIDQSSVQTKQDDLINSFFLLSGSPQVERNSLYRSNYLGPADKPRTSTDIRDVLEENVRLREELERTCVERDALREAYDKAISASRENDVMRKSIVLFRQELTKKARQLREGSGTSELPLIFSNLNPRSPIVASPHLSCPTLRDVKIAALEDQIRILKERNAVQALQIENRVGVARNS